MKIPNEKEKIPEEWFRFAAADLERARKRVADEDVEMVLFHCEQAAEKVLKGWLIRAGWNLEYTHDVRRLLRALADRGADADWFTGTAKTLTTSYVSLRYPFATEELPSLAESTEIFAETEKLLSQLLPTP